MFVVFDVDDDGGLWCGIIVSTIPLFTCAYEHVNCVNESAYARVYVLCLIFAQIFVNTKTDLSKSFGWKKQTIFWVCEWWEMEYTAVILIWCSIL